MTERTRMIFSTAVRRVLARDSRFRRLVAHELRYGKNIRAGGGIPRTASSSIQVAVERVLREYATAVGRQLEKGHEDAVSFGDAYDAGPMAAGVSSDLTFTEGATAPGGGAATGTIGIEVTWNPRDRPTVRLWGMCNLARQPLGVEYAFKIAESPEAVAARVGGALDRSLVNWFGAM